MRNISSIILICFVCFVFNQKAYGESLYKDSSSFLSENAGKNLIFINKSDEKKLEDIQKRKATGNTIFWIGAGLGLIYLAGFFVGGEKKVTFEYYFGVPIISAMLQFYGFGESAAASYDEALLLKQLSARATLEAE